MSSSGYESPSWPSWPSFGIQEMYLACDGHLITTIMYGASLIEVHLHPTGSWRGAEDELIENYKVACNDVVKVWKKKFAADDVASHIMSAGKEAFKKLAPVQSAEDFHPLILPEKLICTLSNVEGEWQITELEKGLHTNVPGGREPMRRAVLEDDTAMDLPRYSTKDIKLVERLGRSGIVARVVVDGQERCVRVLDRNTHRAVQREFDCLKKIAASPYAATIRTPKLLGIVVVPDDGRAIGIIEEYISHPEVYEMSNLGRIGHVTEVDKKRREKWASQIRETVTQLHEIGVVWGDAKPSNVLIEPSTDDVRLIGFGGGFTTPWVDDKMAETVQGDDEAVRKIAAYLKVRLE
ncbi:hypothetical protein QBC46DRAFT_390904 [Diplogelasinospora grovesii]|uniref:Protein kinase domain-containing protein n=1 Tax=Diplogelasinospora grovesii TaxID=303347 RepID=A0AAN6N4B3_9PEZI|nr:hypothetical protein QBC46DRAFT_390904 [Diplogelasinospora grovesii]